MCFLCSVYHGVVVFLGEASTVDMLDSLTQSAVNCLINEACRMDAHCKISELIGRQLLLFQSAIAAPGLYDCPSAVMIMITGL